MLSSIVICLVGVIGAVEFVGAIGPPMAAIGSPIAFGVATQKVSIIV